MEMPQRYIKNLKKPIPYPEAQTANYVPTPGNWKEVVKKSIEIDSSSKHVILLPSGGEEALEVALPAIFYAEYRNSPLFLPMKLKPTSPCFKTERYCNWTK